MKNLDVDWVEFLDALPVYQRMSLPAKASLIANGPYGQPINKSRFGEMQSQVLESGLFTTNSTGNLFLIKPEFRGFVKAMRAIHRSRIDVQPDAHALDLYLADNFTRQEWAALGGGEFYFDSVRRIAIVNVTSPEWLERLLQADNTGWNLRSRGGDPWQGLDTDVLQSLKTIVRKLRASPERRSFEELAKACPRHLLGPAMAAGIQFALFFPMLNRETLDPCVGIWPGITKRLHRLPAVAPREAKVEVQFQAPLLMDDMAVVLAAAAVQPFRVLANSYDEIYQKHVTELAPRLVELPDWTAKYIDFPPESRIRDAVLHLTLLSFLERAQDEERHNLAITEKGKLWLASPPKERLNLLLRQARNAPEEKRPDQYSENGPGDLTPPVAYEYGKSMRVEKEVRDAFRQTAGDGFVRFADFVEYWLGENPFLKSGRRRRDFGGYTQTSDHLDDLWKRILMAATIPGMFRLGAVELGADDTGHLCFRVTPIGRYVLGQAEDFEWVTNDHDAKIIVQPNFDIMFMMPAPRVEAELGRFAERQNAKRIGVLFKITKKSILLAASTGLTAAHVMQTLSSVTSVAVPANVEREIHGWFAQCRTVMGRPAYLIHCPDMETAMRVMSIDPRKLTAISDTVVELQDPSFRSKMAKKLREAGIFL
ncbi:MAG TPA: helicase-associated domain-containing protein [Bryobacteraceae bacterium]|nr:helicase-associated domain-containing protein [Bryobacteraceae bacterium]